MSSWEHLETASNIVRRRNPPRIPWATTLHLSFRTRDDSKVDQKLWFKRYLVAKSWVPNMFCPERYTRGSMVTSWGMASSTSTFLRSPDLILTCILHLTKSSCQELTSGTYFTITLLGKDGLSEMTITSSKNTLTWSTAPRAQRSRIQGTQMALERRSVDLKLLDARRRKTLRRSRGKFVKYEFQ